MRKLVKSQRSNDCGIVAAANAIGTSYAAIRRTFGALPRGGGVAMHEIRWLLSQFGEWKESPSIRSKNISPSAWAARHPQGRHVLFLDVFIDGHAIAVVDGEIIGSYSDEWEVARYWSKVS